MWAIGLILLISICIFVFIFVSNLLPAKGKIIFQYTTILILTPFPFWYHLYPSYYKFKTLCEKDDRVIIFHVADESTIYVYDSNYKIIELVDNRLIATEKTVVHQDIGLMAKAINYRYYQYGNGLAKIIGLSSGTAPSTVCKKEAKINIDEVFPPKQFYH